MIPNKAKIKIDGNRANFLLRKNINRVISITRTKVTILKSENMAMRIDNGFSKNDCPRS